MSGRVERLVRLVNHTVLWVTRHWLALVNTAMALVLLGALLAPVLMLQGYTRAGGLLYRAYTPLCHQLPERSFFIGGPKLVYSLDELNAALGSVTPLRYVGNPELGYKVAFCERDVAIYAGWLVGGLLFGLLRRRARPLRWQVALLMSAPMAVDGLAQLVGLAESNWERRTLTGLLFALAVIWFVYPLLERGMREAASTALGTLEDGGVADR